MLWCCCSICWSEDAEKRMAIWFSRTWHWRRCSTLLGPRASLALPNTSWSAPKTKRIIIYWAVGEGKEKQVAEVVKAASCQFRLVHQMQWIQKTWPVRYALVLSKLVYCNFFYMVFSLKMAQKNVLQLPWFPVCFQVKMLPLTFKFLYDSEPVYLRDCFHSYDLAL